MIKKLRFLIFEKHYLVRQGLVSLIDSLNQCELLEEYSNSDQFHTAIKTYQPHIVLIDLDLAENISEKVIKNLKKECKTVFLGIDLKNAHTKSEYIEDIIYCTDEKQEIIKKISYFINSISLDKGLKKQDNELSEREKEIVALAAKGLTNKEIANELFISIHTAITHRKNIGRKLGIKSISGLTVYAILNKLIDMKDL